MTDSTPATAAMPDQRSLSEQIHDVWEYARQQKMYDAQDWIAARWRGEDLDVKHG